MHWVDDAVHQLSGQEWQLLCLLVKSSSDLTKTRKGFVQVKAWDFDCPQLSQSNRDIQSLRARWTESLDLVLKNFVGNINAWNYQELVKNMQNIHQNFLLPIF